MANHTLDRNGRRQLNHGYIVSDIDFVLSNNEGEIPVWGNVSVKRSSHPQPQQRDYWVRLQGELGLSSAHGFAIRIPTALNDVIPLAVMALSKP